MLLDVGVVPARRQHRVEREADEQRDEHGRGHGDAELVEELADHPAHERDRDEHRDDGESRRHDGEADFRGAFARRVEVVLALLHVPDDVLADDDRIVDQHADRERQPHQREHVEREAEHPHRDERGDDRDRQRQAGDDGRSPRVEEQEHDEDRQQSAEHQRHLHVLDGLANEGRIVAHHLQRHARRQLGRHPGDGLAHAVGDADGVRAGLLLHVERNRGPLVDERDAVASSIPSITWATSRTRMVRSPSCLTGISAICAADVPRAATRTIASVAPRSAVPDRRIDVLRTKRIDYLDQRQAVRLEPRPIDDDLDLALRLAYEVHRAHARTFSRRRFTSLSAMSDTARGVSVGALTATDTIGVDAGSMRRMIGSSISRGSSPRIAATFRGCPATRSASAHRR